MQNFYLGHRLALLHKSLVDNPLHPFPPDSDSRPYEDFPSTKIDALCDLLVYHVGKTCAPPAKAVDGKIVLPGPEDIPADWVVLPDARPDKIIAYLAFPSANWIVIKVCNARASNVPY